MGNKFCKKRVDNTDGSSGSKTPKTLNKIINKLNLKPKWKSDSNLEDKQINSAPILTIQVEPKPLSRSSDWIDCSLEAAPQEVRKESTPSKKSIFNDDTTPTPPPRKCTLVRRSLLDTVKDAFKTSTPNHNNNDDEEEIEEEIMVKKTINYNCPCGGPHSRGQHEKLMRKMENAENKSEQKQSRSILVTSSNSSLPNYNDFRMSLPIRPMDDDAHNSAYSLPDDNVKKMNRRSLSNDIDAYLTRAKSIGSLIPSVLQRLSTTNNKAPLAQIESDDSLNSLDDTNMDDWGAGLNMIEHYEPKESSLPRPSKRSEAEMLADLEGMIVDEIIEEPPKAPARKSETMLKKIHKEVAVRSSNCTPPSTPEEVIIANHARTNQTYNEQNFDNQNDHSPLMKILKEYKNEEHIMTNDSNRNLMRNNISPVHTYTKSVGEAQGHDGKTPINEFLAAERGHDELFKERIAT